MLRYAITDRRMFGVDEASRANALVAQAERLAALGDVGYLQLREKDLPPTALASLARRILNVFHEHAPDPSSRARPRLKLLINSRADVAIAAVACGVHLTSSPGELTPEQVRVLYTEAGLPLPTVSLSCHTLAEVIAVRGLRSEDDLCFAPNPATAPDLLLFGPVFEKRIGDELVAQGSGLKLLREACAAAAPIPVLALGGITEENSAACLEAGASGIAGIRLFSV